MKIRCGFVSNSSSSSFCILGYRIDDEVYEYLNELSDIGYDSKIDTYAGDEEGYVCGVWATEYLENDKLSIAKEKADEYLKNNMSDEAYQKITNNGYRKIDFIYDGYSDY